MTTPYNKMPRFLFIVMINCCLMAGVAAQEKEASSVVFWKNLSALCGKSYEGTITQGGREGDGFTGKKLVMQVKSCSAGKIRIPFYVGDDSSRTWVLSLKDNIITLKHDHRHKDGLPDSITWYGGTASNTGAATMQVFPADQETCSLISYACSNVWWITLDKGVFTYNLRRIGSDRLFTVSFDITKPVELEGKPWGWEE